jgi:hypothetical protein
MKTSKLARLVCVWLGLVVFGSLIIGCGSLPPPFGQPTRVVQTSSPTIPLPPPATETPAPTNTPVIPPTPIIPTITPTPTQAPLPNLTAVKLVAKDMPSGFQEVTTDDLRKMNLTEEALGNAFRGIGAQARVQNLAAFQHPQRYQIVLGFLIYPLTPVERAAVEAQLANPDTALKAWGEAVVGPTGSTKAKPLVGVDKFGNKSVGFTTTATMLGVNVRNDAVMIARGGVVAVGMSFYPEAAPPLFATADLAKTLDTRLATTLSGK